MEIKDSEAPSAWELFEQKLANSQGLKRSYAEIRRATSNFSPKLLICEDEFGQLFRGTLRCGAKMKVTVERQQTGPIREFQAKIMASSQIHHPNIVSLIGYCDTGDERILVYETREMKTLQELLNFSVGDSETSSSQSNLSWEQRLQICIGSAEGLHFLHTGCGWTIVHGDVQPFNILVDENYTAKLADLGLSTSVYFDSYRDKSSLTTRKGTNGYVAPEHAMFGSSSEKSDVYSYGVVLLEVLCAKRWFQLFSNGVNWWRGELENIVDPALVGTICPASLRTFCDTTEKCLRQNSDERPGMREVLWNLELALELQQDRSKRDHQVDRILINACSELLFKAICSYSYYINEDASVEGGNLPSGSTCYDS